MFVSDLLERGRTLFNDGKFYEAHELWEDLWRETAGPIRVSYQGLIQAAVALHHLHRGNFTGARGLLRKALRNLDKNSESEATGLDINGLAGELKQCLGALSFGNDLAPESRPAFPRIRRLK